MPRNISFALTTQQILARTKTVTRRLGWRDLEPGVVLNACVKCMGLRPGETVQRLAVIRVTNVTREELRLCTNKDAALEGFPQLTGAEFVAMFCTHMKCKPEQLVTRIEFEYVEARTKQLDLG